MADWNGVVMGSSLLVCNLYLWCIQLLLRDRISRLPCRTFFCLFFWINLCKFGAGSEQPIATNSPYGIDRMCFTPGCKLSCTALDIESTYGSLPRRPAISVGPILRRCSCCCGVNLMLSAALQESHVFGRTLEKQQGLDLKSRACLSST